MRQTAPVNILSIGGSDPSSGSGVPGDARALSALGHYCLGVITAITAQNTEKFSAAEPVSPGMVRAQIKSVLSDFDVAGVKIGMVYDGRIMKEIRKALLGIGVPIVIDPVLRSTTGGTLLEKSEMEDFKKQIIPLATVLTPNLEEARMLAGSGTPQTLARKITSMGASSVIITGIKTKEKISDYILQKTGNKYAGSTITGRYVRRPNRGSGTVHSATVVSGLASGMDVKAAAIQAKQAAYRSILSANKRGRGLKITEADSELTKAIEMITSAAGMAEMIPQCQTNFVFGKRPKKTSDVLGVSGRIVRAGDSAIMAGSIAYGGSKHVASALVAASARFPSISSAANVRYSEGIVRRAKKAGMLVCGYDRSKEPESVSSVQWGVSEAVRGSKGPPDIIYHTGAWGKEPMVLVFGRRPREVAEKIMLIMGHK